MSEFFPRLSELRKALAREYGPFRLFALFMPDDKAPDRWDLVVSAPWLTDDNLDALRLVTIPLQNRLDIADLLRISTVVVLLPDEPFVHELEDLVVRGQGLELPGEPIMRPGTRLWYGSPTKIAEDWVELPRSTFNDQQFERVVLFWNAPVESTGAAPAAAAAG